MTVTSNRTFTAFVNDTGLESVTNRLRVKVDSIPGDHTWETQIRIEIPPGRELDGKLSYRTYTIVVTLNDMFTDSWSIRLVTGDAPWGPDSRSRVRLEQEIRPQRVEAYGTSFRTRLRAGMRARGENFSTTSRTARCARRRPGYRLTAAERTSRPSRSRCPRWTRSISSTSWLADCSSLS